MIILPYDLWNIDNIFKNFFSTFDMIPGNTSRDLLCELKAPVLLAGYTQATYNSFVFLSFVEKKKYHTTV